MKELVRIQMIIALNGQGDGTWNETNGGFGQMEANLMRDHLHHPEMKALNSHFGLIHNMCDKVPACFFLGEVQGDIDDFYDQIGIVRIEL